MNELNKLLNIGKVMQKRLAEIGIMDSNELFELGIRVAFTKLHLHEGDICFSSLCAFEGVIQGKCWHDLNEEMKKN